MALLKANTGIGTTNPTAALHVFGNSIYTGIITAQSFSGTATTAISAGYASTAGVSTYASSSGIATYASTAGVSTYASTAGVATALQNARTFEITGDVVASSIIFDGTGNVSLAATIQPNSVALGTDTTGDYVQSVSGTANQITVASGTGEGSAPTLSIPSQFTAPQDVEVTRDLQVNRNLNVNGNITIGGTSATLFTTEFKVYDPDIVLGFRTDSFGNDVSTDNTANHGGIAIASTEGSPLVQLFIAGIETNPTTYKKIMWFKAGEFSGLGTDAWLSNYAVGIGSTQFPTGTRLAAGAVQFTERDLAVVRNINASGVVTASSFSGNASSATYASASGIATYTSSAGIATYSSTAGLSTYASSSGIATYASTSGISTVSEGLTGAPNITVGVATATSFVKSGGTSSQFLKADGSVDSSTYLTSYTETDTLNSVTGRGNSTANGISVGVLTATTGNYSGIVTSSGAIISGTTTATSFVKSGGTSNEFLKADGSVDANTYLTTTGSGINLTGIVTSIVAGSNITISGSTGQVTINSTASGGGGGSAVAYELDILEVIMFS